MRTNLLILITIIFSMNSYAKVNHQKVLYPAHLPFEDSQEKKRIITQIYDKYRDQIISRYGKDVELIFHPADVLQMTGGHNRDGELEITVYAGVLKKLDELAIVQAMCHEVGHILGEVTMRDAGSAGPYNPLDSVEGEADYFSGSCSRQYFDNNPISNNILQSSYCSINHNACNEAVMAARSVLLALYGKEVDEELAYDSVYSENLGINPSYPNASCRLLSVIAGIQETARPKCWYNPK